MNERQDTLDAAIAALPKTMEPERDLWPEIAGQLSVSHGYWQWRVAASVLAVTLLIGLLLVPPSDGPMEAASPPVPMLDAQLVRHAAFDAQFMRDYQRSLDELATQLNQLPPGTRDIVIGNLEIIRESIGQINAAIDREPNNVQLRQLLELAYRQEMAIVSTVRDSAIAASRAGNTI